MITLQNNPIINDQSQEQLIMLAQTRDTLIDTETYSRFVYACKSAFRKSRFYKDYKSYIMNFGLNRDAMMYGITSDMADLELHHNLPTLHHAVIMITEHLLNTKGCCTTFEVIKALEEAHRNNWMGVTILSETNHAVHEDNPTSFISLKQCIGDPFQFIDHYIDGMTLDISYKMLLHFKLEQQYGDSYATKIVRARDQILSWRKQQ